MTCRECDQFIADYLGGALPAGERERFEEHLQRCGNCREYLRQYGDTIRAERTACAECDSHPPEELVRAIVAARKGAGGVT